jgi:DNA-binding MarR family transcriptional regulator
MSPSIRLAPDFDLLYPAASVTATECAMNLVFTADLLQKRIATLLQPFHLTPASGLVLSMLAEAASPLPPNEIADRLIISRATVTGLLDSLERRAYIRRRPHPSDRRMILADITEAGRQTASAFRPIVHQQEKEWFGVLGEEEQQQLLSVLHRVQERLRDAG